jgi:hypothetical protein
MTIPLLTDAIRELEQLDPASAMALMDVARERVRQIRHEDRQPVHDDRYVGRELARAAASYLLAQPKAAGTPIPFPPMPTIWPWDPIWWKPRSRYRNNVRGAALALAEIARVIRMGVAAARANEAAPEDLPVVKP